MLVKISSATVVFWPHSTILFVAAAFSPSVTYRCHAHAIIKICFTSFNETCHFIRIHQDVLLVVDFVLVDVSELIHQQQLPRFFVVGIAVVIRYTFVFIPIHDPVNILNGLQLLLLSV